MILEEGSFTVLVLVCSLTPDWRHSFYAMEMGGVQDGIQEGPTMCQRLPSFQRSVFTMAKALHVMIRVARASCFRIVSKYSKQLGLTLLLFLLNCRTRSRSYPSSC